MKTEENISNLVKTERKKVFWRLHSLPWILSIIVLLCVTIGSLYFSYSVIQTAKLISVEESGTLRQLGIDEGKRVIQLEAVKVNCGEWLVNDEGVVSFNWIEKLPPIHPRDFMETTEEVEVIPEVKEVIKREYPFDWSDYKLSEELGLNLEEMLIGSVRVSIQDQFEKAKKANLSYVEFEGVVKDGAEKVIRKSFDGFETYHKIK